MMIGQAARGITRLTLQPRHAFSMLNDYFTQKNVKKQEAEFKREMEYLANKPSFTLMDYKQRVIDELNKLKSQFRAKLDKDAQEQEKKLQMEKKVLSAFFEEELNLERRIKFQQKKEVSLVSQLPVDFVSKVYNKFEEYRSMQRVLRQLRLNNEPLPQTVSELQQLYLMNPVSRDNKKFKYHQFKHHTKVQRNRHLKKTHDHGHFDC